MDDTVYIIYFINEQSESPCHHVGKCSIIRELILYEFGQGHKILEVTKNTNYAKVEANVDHCTVTRCVEKIRCVCKKLDDQKS